MRLIISPFTDVYFNLAAEAYFLQHTQENICMLWRSQSAVVCGKNQGICAEINYSLCKELGIFPARRVSGGGTVYQDLGNVNFTFIQGLETSLDNAIDYKRFLEPVRKALLKMGIETSYSQRHDLLYKGKKISGNAQHLMQQKKRVLHHGTLLLNANLKKLSRVLQTEGTYSDRSVRSVRSEVTNLADHFPQLMQIEQSIVQLSQALAPLLLANFSGFSEQETTSIIRLQTEKFETEAWILGYSPNYIHTRTISFPNSNNEHTQDLRLNMEVERGIICTISLNDEHGNSVFEKQCADTLQKPIAMATIASAFSNTPLGKIPLLYQFF